jgi:hypothetical protein
MAAIATLKALLQLDDKQYQAGMKKASSSTKNLQGQISSLSRVMAGAFSVTAIVAFGRALVKAGSQLEDFETQFRAFGFSAEEAKKRIEDLNNFAARTPFQLGDIVAASQQLESFSGGLLGNVASLKMFGDAAAAVGQRDLQSVTFWVGRLFGELKNGLPFIRSANALSRLKIINSDTVAELIRMRDANASNIELWEAFTGSIKKFEGGMERLSKTVSGKTSTMKDNWIKAFGAMGQATKSLQMVVIGTLTKSANAIEMFVGGLQLLAAQAGALSAGASMADAKTIAREQVFGKPGMTGRRAARNLWERLVGLKL